MLLYPCLEKLIILKPMTKKLYRSNKNKILSGVLGGLGEYAEIDPAIIRIIFILILIFTGFIPGLIAYFLFIIVIPKKAEKTK